MKNKMIRAVIVDDEKPSREALSNYIREYCPDVEVVAECKSAKSAFKSIQENSPQLVFLDIEMPKGNGFDLLKMFKTIPFKVIFITAYSEYAIQAFRFSATDYLMKPVNIRELTEAVNKVRQDLERKDPFSSISTLMENLESPGGKINKLVIPDNKGFSVIRLNDLVCCKSERYCTLFHLAGNETVLSTKNLKHYEELLSPDQFMRIHNSWLINLRHVTGYTHEGEVILTGNLHCPLSVGSKPEFLKFFRKLR